MLLGYDSLTLTFRELPLDALRNQVVTFLFALLGLGFASFYRLFREFRLGFKLLYGFSCASVWDMLVKRAELLLN